MNEILSYAQTCQAHLDLRQEKLSRSLTKADTFWDYLDLLEPDYKILLADTFTLVAVFMVSGINAFRDLDPKNARSDFLSELVAKYTISDKSESFAIGICNLVSRHPIAIAYHLKWDYKLKAFGTLNGLPECLAFPGGWKLIPESEEWLPLMVLWHMWNHSLRGIKIPPNTAEYLYQEYYVADRFDPVTAMSFLDVNAPESYMVILILERLIKEYISSEHFVEDENVLSYINEMYPQCHRCIIDFYSTYKKGKSFPRPTDVENEDVQCKVSELMIGSNLFRNMLSDRGIESISKGFTMEALFAVKEYFDISLIEETNHNPLQRSSRIIYTKPSRFQKELKYKENRDVQMHSTQGLSDEHLMLDQYGRFPNYGSFSVQTEAFEKGQAYQTKSKIPENLGIPRNWCGRPRTKSCDSQVFTNLRISSENLNVFQTSSAKNAPPLVSTSLVEQISTFKIKKQTEIGEVEDSTKLPTTSMSPEKHMVVRGHRRGKGDQTKFNSFQKLPDLRTRPYTFNISQPQTTKNAHITFPDTSLVIQTLPSLLENVRIRTSKAREIQKERDGKKGLTQFQYKIKTSEPSASCGRGLGRGLRTKFHIPQKVPSLSSSHFFAQVRLPSLDNPPESPDQFEECRDPQNKESEDPSPSKRQ